MLENFLFTPMSAAYRIASVVIGKVISDGTNYFNVALRKTFEVVSNDLSLSASKNLNSPIADSSLC